MIKEMLTAYNQNPENDAVKSFFQKDNIWKILNVERYEPSHSAFLVWFFNQKSFHHSHLMYFINLLVARADKQLLQDGWNSTDDMKNFADAVLTGSYNIKTASATPELSINKISKIPSQDRLDVFVRCIISLYDSYGNAQEKTLEIIIENKVKAAEGEAKGGKAKDKLSSFTSVEDEYNQLHQTERYYFACSKQDNNRLKDDVDYQLFVFLTPDRKECKSENYILISYQDLVDYVFDNYLKRNDIDPDARILIEGYLNNLGNPYNNNNIIAMNTDEKELLVKFYKRNQKLFEVMIEALIKQADDDGEDEIKASFEEVKEGLKKAESPRRLYIINNDKEHRYKMWEVIREFINFKLRKCTSFDDIKEEIAKITPRATKFLFSRGKDDLITGSGKKQPHYCQYSDVEYYVTTELKDKEKNNNFRKFKEYVNKKYKEEFRIDDIDI